MKSQRKLIVLRGYKKIDGRNTLLKKSNGEVENLSFTAHLTYVPRKEGTKKSEFHKYIEGISIHDFVDDSIEVLSCLSHNEDGSWGDECEVPKEVLDLIVEYRTGVDKMSEDDKRLARLERRLEMMDEEAKKREDEQKEATKQLLVDTYQRITGKKPHHLKTAEQIAEMIKELDLKTDKK